MLTYFLQIVPLLLHAKLILIPEYDAYLAKMIASQSREAIEFAVFLVQTFMLKSQILPKSDYPNTIDQLAKIGALPIDSFSFEEGAPIERAKRPEFDYVASRKLGAPAEQKLAALVDEWFKTFQQSATNERAIPTFVQRLQQGGYYGGKDTPFPQELHFYRACIETAVFKASEGDTSERDPDKGTPHPPITHVYKSLTVIFSTQIGLLGYRRDREASGAPCKALP